MFNLTSKQNDLNRQLTKNLVFNIGFFCLNIVIGLLLVPFFINTLGVASYALIPLATSMTSYINLIIQSLNSSVSRYLTIDIHKGNYKEANLTFNTALFGTLALIILMLPIVFITSYYAPVFFSIPSDQKQDAMLLFVCVICSFLLRLWSSNFGVSLFAHNRLDLQKIIDSINALVQVFLIIVLFAIFSPKLSYIGLSYLFSALVASIVTIYFFRKVDPHLKIKIKDFKLTYLKRISETGGWLTITQIGTLLYLQIDLIVVNKLFGTAIGGEYSIILMWSILIRGVAGTISGVLAPMVLAHYANNKFQEIVNMSQISVKFMGIAMALPIGFICGFSPFILSLWVGPEYVKLYPLMLIHLMHLVVNLSVLPLFSINVAYNKVKIPGLVTFFMGVGNLLLAITLSLFTDWGFYGVAIAGAIMLTAKNSLFTPLYAAKIMDVSKNTFIKSMLSGLIITFIIAGVCGAISLYIDPSLLNIVISCVVISVLYLIFSWTICLNNDERRVSLSFIPLMIRRKLKIV